MTLTYALGAMDPNQLHQELLKAFPTWQGTQRADGIWMNPLLRVEFTDKELRLTVPEETDPSTVEAIVKAHVARPPEDNKQVRVDAIAKLQAATKWTDEELSAMGLRS